MAVLNLVKTNVSNTPGNASGFVTSTAVTPYQTWLAGGAVDGASYSYVATDSGGKFECGHGTWTASTGTLSRDVIYDSSAGYGVKETFSASAQVYSTPLKADLPDQAALKARRRLIQGSLL